MPRMRTIDEAIKLLKADDPQCQLTKNAIRELVLNNEIPYILIGKRKRLINYDALLDKLNNLESPAASRARIRALPEKFVYNAK